MHTKDCIIALYLFDLIRNHLKKLFYISDYYCYFYYLLCVTDYIITILISVDN